MTTWMSLHSDLSDLFAGAGLGGLDPASFLCGLPDFPRTGPEDRPPGPLPSEPERAETPPAVDDALTVREDEGPGDTDINVLANDGAPRVFAVNGTPGSLGARVPGSDGGSFVIAADGSADFDAAGAFEALGAGETATTSVTYSVARTGIQGTYDLMLVQDLSGSFINDLPNVQAQFGGLSGTLAARGDDVAFGVASFVDKPVDPFGEADAGDYAFSLDQAMSADAAETQATLDGLIVRNGGDAAEAQLIALQQIALRADTDAGFRDGAQRFVVLQTDNVFHRAGDFADVPADDGDTDTAETEDYPRIGDVGALLQDAGITVIFAVTRARIPVYDRLLTQLGVEGAVVQLSSNSSNLESAVIGALEGLTTLSTATLTVTVEGVNDAPVALDDTARTGERAPVIIDVLANDDDAEADTLAITALGQDGLRGTVRRGPDATLIYDPSGAFDELAADERATETFTYTVSDGRGGTDTASVTVTIDGLNDAPAATDDRAATRQGMAITIDVTANDLDPNGDALRITDLSDPGGGTVLLLADGRVSYSPEDGFFGSDTFFYTVTDGLGGTSSAEVVVAVERNLPPVLPEPIVFDAPENQTAAAALDAIDAEDDPVTYTIAGGADAALFRIDPADGVLVFREAPDFETPGDRNGDNRYALDIRVADRFGDTVQEVLVTVTDVDDTPNTPPAFVTPETALTPFDDLDNRLGLTTADIGEIIDFGAEDPDDDDLVFTLLGPDADAFDFDRITGVLSLRSPISDPMGSADGDAIFELQALVEDGAGGADRFDFELALITVA